jgi:hypothetical protein
MLGQPCNMTLYAQSAPCVWLLRSHSSHRWPGGNRASARESGGSICSMLHQQLDPGSHSSALRMASPSTCVPAPMSLPFLQSRLDGLESSTNMAVTFQSRLPEPTLSLPEECSRQCLHRVLPCQSLPPFGVGSYVSILRRRFRKPISAGGAANVTS